MENTEQKPSVTDQLPESPILQPKGSGIPKILIIAFILPLLVAIGFCFYFIAQIFNTQSDTVGTATPAPTVRLTPSPTPNPTAGWKTYSNNQDVFSFQYPEYFSIQKEAAREIIWQAEYIKNSVTPNQMVLRNQLIPFPVLQENSSISIGTFSAKVTNIDETNKMILDDLDAQTYIYACGVDCYYYTLRFKRNNTYYELTQNIAGGGLQQQFGTLLSTFKFEVPAPTGNFSAEGQSCGPNAGAAGDAKCASGLTCSKMQNGIGTCVKVTPTSKNGI